MSVLFVCPYCISEKCVLLTLYEAVVTILATCY
jgi:hypothetical protein